MVWLWLKHACLARYSLVTYQYIVSPRLEKMCFCKQLPPFNWSLLSRRRKKSRTGIRGRLLEKVFVKSQVWRVSTSAFSRSKGPTVQEACGNLGRKEESIYYHRRVRKAEQEAWSKPAIQFRPLALQIHSCVDRIVRLTRNAGGETCFIRYQTHVNPEQWERLTCGGPGLGWIVVYNHRMMVLLVRLPLTAFLSAFQEYRCEHFRCDLEFFIIFSYAMRTFSFSVLPSSRISCDTLATTNK